jgi:hypothetical protein
MTEITPLLMAFVKTLGFKDAKDVYWEAITGTPHNVLSRNVKSFIEFFHCLENFEYHVLHITSPKVELEGESPFMINQIDILIRKEDHSFVIDRIFIEEEEYDLKTDLEARVKKLWEITKFGLTLFSLFSRFFPNK